MLSGLWTLATLAASISATASPPYSSAHYRVLPAEGRSGSLFSSVDISYGPLPDTCPGGTAWQLTVRESNDTATQPLLELRAVTTRDPLADSSEPFSFLQYQLHIPDSGAHLEYRNIITGKTLLPTWGDFARLFIPQPVYGIKRQHKFPVTCEYLGHVLTLDKVLKESDWPEWKDVKILSQDPELLIGTSRASKESEGHRLPQKPQRQDYHYQQLKAEDYQASIEAGANLFCVSPDQERYVCDKPVFYIRGAAGDPPLRYPADLYRSNYAGNEMFIDEPTSIMVSDKRVHTTLRYFSDAAALITQRTRANFIGPKGAKYGLERDLAAFGVSFGDMRLANIDFPTWETVYETAYYQLAGGVSGFVHEGRYQLDEFNANAKASTGLDHTYTAQEMLRYTYAFMRGAARRFGKDWGTSIYGQADPKLSPLAMSIAYDMGARYLWYWSSDHDHHLPWLEQLELTRTIRKYMAAHKRPSIRGPQPVLDEVILIPYGYFLTMESPTGRKQSYDLWWVRELDPEGKNEASQKYRRLMRRTLMEVIKAFEAGKSFDICVDDGSQFEGYRQIVRISDE